MASRIENTEHADQADWHKVALALIALCDAYEQIIFSRRPAPPDTAQDAPRPE